MPIPPRFIARPIPLLTILACLALGLLAASAAQKGEAPERVLRDLPYYGKELLATASEYQRTQCRLDLALPTDRKGFATVVWFHGGGLTGGKRGFPPLLLGRGLGVAAVGYRLSPKAQCPEFIDDAAAAVAWVLRNIERHGGDPKRVFVAGHSAGGYLTAMVGMDPKWLAPHGFSPKDLAGLIPVSAQVSTHFLVKKLRGDTGPQYRPLIDAYAPLYYCAADLPPICLIVGDRAIEWKARVEENALLAASLRSVGHPNVEFYEMGGLNHGMVGEAGLVVARAFIQRVIAPAKEGAAKTGDR